LRATHEPDELTGVQTTGHEWDGIRELNNPLPRWWLWTFYATIVFAVGYVIAYPALPGLTGATKGWSGWSSRADLRSELAAATHARAASLDKIGSMDVAAILKDDALRSFSIAAGGSAFKVYCSQCHGSGAAGGFGYPNLNDDSWIWGGKPNDIYTTIRHGIHYDGDPETRVSQMPAFGKDKLLDAVQIGDAAWYVRKLSQQQFDAPAAQRGEIVFKENCVSCHGDTGQGNAVTGSPQLNDAIWLYGGGFEQIASQIKAPRHGVMPAWSTKLGDTLVKKLAVYVHSLGGGEKVD
jgi:cytochrome c oxidase cbb3-type subunit 3